MSAAATSNYNIYLVAALKNGAYAYMRIMDTSFTLSTSSLTFHTFAGTTYYADVNSNNHKRLVAAADSYFFILFNF